jgi:very-short-patch-repair endonuclease
MIGQKIGRWTVIGRGKTTTASRQIKWICECDCDKHTQREIAGVELRRGTTLSCGCLRESHGEYKISKLLTDAKIPFESEKKFDTCILPSGIKARFDFWVNNEYIIEFDGKQHFLELKDYFQEPLTEIQKRDTYKNLWCK